MSQQVFNYNGITNEYSHTSTALVDPMETKNAQVGALQTKRDDALVANESLTDAQLAAITLTDAEANAVVVYLLPGNATFDVVPAAVAANARVFEADAWAQKVDFRGQTIYNQINGDDDVCDYIGALLTDWDLTAPVLPWTTERVEAALDSFINDLDAGLDITAEPTTELMDELNAEQTKRLKIEQSRKKYNHAMDWILADYSEPEINSWPEQKNAATAWDEYIAANGSATDANADYDSAPMLKELAKGKNKVLDAGLTIALMDERSAKILEKSDFFRPYSGGVTGTKKAVDGDIDAVDLIGLSDADAKAALLAIVTDDILSTGLAYLGL